MDIMTAIVLMHTTPKTRGKETVTFIDRASNQGSPASKSQVNAVVMKTAALKRKLPSKVTSVKYGLILLGISDLKALTYLRKIMKEMTRSPNKTPNTDAILRGRM
jgi:hypothetical protein